MNVPTLLSVRTFFIGDFLIDILIGEQDGGGR